MNDKTRVIQLVAGLAETFGRKLSEAGYEGYWRGLRDLELEAVARATDEALRSSKFMPSVRELRGWSGEESAEDRALKAWQAVDSVASEIGSYRSPRFDDPLINATIRSIGGWTAILDKDTDEWNKWLRKDFLTVYASFYRSGVSGDVCRRLQGLADESPIDVPTGLPMLPAAVQGRISQVYETVAADPWRPRLEFNKP